MQAKHKPTIGRGRPQESVTRLAMLAAEKAAEIVVLWAIGDASGPLNGEVKFDLNGRRSFKADVQSRMRTYRSRETATRVEVYIRGECSGLRLKTAVEHRLHELGCGCERPGWFRAAGIIAGIVTECAEIEGVRLLTEDQAREVELRELEKIMDRM